MKTDNYIRNDVKSSQSSKTLAKPQENCYKAYDIWKQRYLYVLKHFKNTHLKTGLSIKNWWNLGKCDNCECCSEIIRKTKIYYIKKKIVKIGINIEPQTNN